MNAVPAPPADMEAEWTEPQLLRIRHLTRYLYEGEVWDNFNEARLCPVTGTTQDCLEFALRINPSAIVRDFPDFYSNCVHCFDVQFPHNELNVESLSLVKTHPDTRGPLAILNPPAALNDTSIMENYYEFLNDSDYVSLGAEVWHEAVDALPRGVSDLWNDTLTIGNHIYKTFKYTPRATTVNTRPAEVVKTRQGVCQDFAHLMLGMCRVQGIPARYVSGYFFNPSHNPDETEASHAWVEIFLPGYGWKGYDPTHHRLPDTRYVKVATGRDYGDIRPVSGTFRGRGTRELVVEVQIKREEI